MITFSTFFRQEGYFQVDVNPEINVDSRHKVANVAFHVALGRKAKFGVVSIDGGAAADQANLQHKISSPVARLRGAAIRPGKSYHHSTLTKAQEYLQSLLQKQGFLSAQVKLSGAEYHADTNRADIHFTCESRRADARTNYRRPLVELD